MSERDHQPAGPEPDGLGPAGTQPFGTEPLETDWNLRASTYSHNDVDREVPAPLDQQPVDQQRIIRPIDPMAIEYRDDGPRLPGGLADRPAIAQRPVAPPPIRPLQTTAPDELVVATPTEPSAFRRRMTARRAKSRSAGFAPLRSDPPPNLMSTMVARSVLVVVMLAALGATMWTEFTGAAGDVRTSPLVIGLHLVAAIVLVAWSYMVMHNADVIAPATRYQPRSRGWVAAGLWVCAFSAPSAVAIAHDRLRDRLDDPNDLTAVFLLSAVVLAGFIFVWMPFHHLARHGHRVGAPRRTMASWFWLPLFALVGGILIVALGLGELLADGGWTSTERTIQVGVVYGLPMLLFVATTWQAVTVFDEVIDLRWQRWKTEWEQTLVALADEPAPGPEDSPNLTTHS